MPGKPAEVTDLVPMTPEDHRALTPAIHAHINPYGRLTADLSRRIDCGWRRDGACANGACSTAGETKRCASQKPGVKHNRKATE
jgi:hypothetical protein